MKNTTKRVFAVAGLLALGLSAVKAQSVPIVGYHSAARRTDDRSTSKFIDNATERVVHNLGMAASLSCATAKSAARLVRRSFRRSA